MTAIRNCGTASSFGAHLLYILLGLLVTRYRHVFAPFFAPFPRAKEKP